MERATCGFSPLILKLSSLKSNNDICIAQIHGPVSHLILHYSQKNMRKSLAIMQESGHKANKRQSDVLQRFFPLSLRSSRLF
jgi:hypothetical protein